MRRLIVTPLGARVPMVDEVSAKADAKKAVEKERERYRELLIKYMRSCIECGGTTCLMCEDDADSNCTANADIGISPEEYGELKVLAEEAKKRSTK